MSAVLPGQKAGPYEVREFDLTAVTGLSARAVDIHLELYRGYVKALNTLLAEQRAAFPAAGEPATPLDLAAHARRFAFEHNGVVLHELFFEALGAPDSSSPDKQGKLATQLHGRSAVSSNGSSMRRLSPSCVASAGSSRCTTRCATCSTTPGSTCTISACRRTCGVVLALDMWEHAYLLDFAPAQRGNYFDCSGAAWTGARSSSAAADAPAGRSPGAAPVDQRRCKSGQRIRSLRMA